jgi:hypothetical protein
MVMLSSLPGSRKAGILQPVAGSRAMVRMDRRALLKVVDVEVAVDLAAAVVDEVAETSIVLR